MRSDFAVFILTHGRPDNIKTLRALKTGNYTGKLYIVIDNEDDTADRYRELYGDKVIQFDKLAESKKFDTADLSEDRRAIVYARNVCFDLAEQLGLEYFLELDDDYTAFMFRYICGAQLKNSDCKDLDRLFEDCIEFLDSSGALSVALAQGGDLIGGANNFFRKGLSSKAMNTFFCKTSRRFWFVGRVNEDVNTYTSLGNKGGLFLTITNTQICQQGTQSQAGGMSEMYLDSGTYVKSFYSVIFSPQAVRVAEMGAHHRRMHHRVNWNACTPKILSDRYRKRR